MPKPVAAKAEQNYIMGSGGVGTAPIFHFRMSALEDAEQRSKII